MASTLYNTVQRVICQAYENAGLIQVGNEPNSSQYAKGMDRLNDLIGVLQTRGIKLWTNQDIPFTLEAGTGTYTLGSGGTVPIRSLRVIQGYYLDSNNLRRPLIALSRQEYVILSNPSEQGSINSYYFNPQQSLAQVTFWLVPDAQAATGTAHLIVQQPITYVDGMLDQINFPQEWYMALHWGLGDELATGQPMAIQQRCSQRAGQFLQALEDWDVEEPSTFFQVDTQQQQRGSFS